MLIACVHDLSADCVVSAPDVRVNPPTFSTTWSLNSVSTRSPIYVRRTYNQHRILQATSHFTIGSRSTHSIPRDSVRLLSAM